MHATFPGEEAQPASTRMRVPLTTYHRQSLFWGAVALLAGVLLWALRPVLTPFLLGAIIAYVLQPGVEWLVRHRTPRGLAALLMISLIAMLIGLFALLVFAVLQKEGPELARQLPSMVQNLDAVLRPRMALLGIDYSVNLANIREALTARLSASEQGAAPSA